MTWREEIILKYDSENLHFLGEIDIDENVHQLRAGYGLAEYSDKLLLATDGTSEIFFLKCRENLKYRNRINVREDGELLDRLGDIVFVEGAIYANKINSYFIYKINPQNGEVEKKWDMKALVENEIRMGTLDIIDYGHGDILSGIAYDKIRGLFILTGKNWGFIYEVKLE